MRRHIPLTLLIAVTACTGTTDATTTSDAPTTTERPSTTTAAPRPVETTAEALARLGGEPCPDSDFTCVGIEVPLDHAEPEGEKTTVVFAVLPATVERTGVFVTATGGPGTSGIASADSYTSAFDSSITDSFDIVFYDQRGVAASGGLSCPQAATVYYRADVFGVAGIDQTLLTDAASTFVTDCLAEMGDTELLPHLATSQVAADIEAFRVEMGYEKVVLYGESYGTQVAQTYAAAFPEGLERLIIDGTVDLTLDGFDFFAEQSRAFDDVLSRTFDECLEDFWCSGDTAEDPHGAYDDTVALLSEGPLSAEFPLPGGGSATRSFGLADLEVVAGGQLYTEYDRMLLMRALAAFADRGDLVPLLRLLYVNLGVDPQDEAIIEDPTWSDAIYYGVECLDYHYPGNTPEEKAAAFFAAGANNEGMRLGSLVYGDLPCAFWPVSADDQERPEALRAEGIPTLVLGATADPATPYSQGVTVFGRLEDGYLISQEGGPHIIFGRGNECPDDAVTRFIVDGEPPAVANCPGYVVDFYYPLFPNSLEVFFDAEEMLDSIETEVSLFPEYWYWDGVTDLAVGCTFGGRIEYSADESSYLIALTECGLGPDAVVDGIGVYDYENDVFTFDDIAIGSDECRYTYIRAGEDYEVVDNCATDLFD